MDLSDPTNPGWARSGFGPMDSLAVRGSVGRVRLRVTTRQVLGRATLAQVHPLPPLMGRAQLPNLALALILLSFLHSNAVKQWLLDKQVSEVLSLSRD